MRQEISYGIVPFIKKEGQWHLFLVQHKQGHWAMPKGHLEPGEKPLETASRELLEETSLHIEKILSEDALIEEYQFRKGKELIHKQVGYFPAIVSGTPVLQLVELKAGRWFSLDEALNTITFKEAKAILSAAIQFLS